MPPSPHFPIIGMNPKNPTTINFILLSHSQQGKWQKPWKKSTQCSYINTRSPPFQGIGEIPTTFLLLEFICVSCEILTQAWESLWLASHQGFPIVCSLLISLPAPLIWTIGSLIFLASSIPFPVYQISKIGFALSPLKSYLGHKYNNLSCLHSLGFYLWTYLWILFIVIKLITQEKICLYYIQILVIIGKAHISHSQVLLQKTKTLFSNHLCIFLLFFNYSRFPKFFSFISIQHFFNSINFDHTFYSYCC